MKERYLEIVCCQDQCLFGALHCCNWYVNSIRSIRLVCVWYTYYRQYCIAKISVTSPIVINMPTRELLAGETKNTFVWRFEHLNNKNNVCKQIYSLYTYMFAGSTVLCCFSCFSSSFCISWYFLIASKIQDFNSLVELLALNSHVPYKDETGTGYKPPLLIKYYFFSRMAIWFGPSMVDYSVVVLSIPPPPPPLSCLPTTTQLFTCFVDIPMFEKFYSCVLI